MAPAASTYCQLQIGPEQTVGFGMKDKLEHFAKRRRQRNCHGSKFACHVVQLPGGNQCPCYKLSISWLVYFKLSDFRLSGWVNKSLLHHVIETEILLLKV